MWKPREEAWTSLHCHWKWQCTPKQGHEWTCRSRIETLLYTFLIDGQPSLLARVTTSPVTQKKCPTGQLPDLRSDQPFQISSTLTSGQVPIISAVMQVFLRGWQAGYSRVGQWLRILGHLVLPTFRPHSVPTSPDFTDLWNQTDPNLEGKSGLCRPQETNLQVLPPVLETGASTIPTPRHVGLL